MSPSRPARPTQRSQPQATRRTRPPTPPPPDVTSQAPICPPTPSLSAAPPAGPGDVPSSSQDSAPRSTSSRTQSPTPTISHRDDVPSQAPKRRRGARAPVHLQYVFNISGFYAAKSTLFTHRDGEDEQYYQLGKMVPRLVHPFLPVQQLLHFGSRLYTQLHAEDDDSEALELGNEVETL